MAEHQPSRRRQRLGRSVAFLLGIGLCVVSAPGFLFATLLAQPEFDRGQNPLPDSRRWGQLIVALAATTTSAASVVVGLREPRERAPARRGFQLVALATILWIVWVGLVFDWGAGD
jgi:hypothetical protein